MKKLAFILLLIFILALQAPAFAEEPVIDGRQNLITRLYTGGASDFVFYSFTAHPPLPCAQ